MEPVPMGIGRALSVKRLDHRFNIIDELTFFEFNLQENETLTCNEIEEDGAKVQFMKNERIFGNDFRFYSMLTKRDAVT